MPPFFQLKKQYFFLLSVVWILAIIFVNPIGDFPLNDDGIYSRWLKSVFFEGTHNFENIIVPNLILQTVWGALLCELSGSSSLTILRISTLILAYCSIFLTYHLSQSILKKTHLSITIAAAFAFNPIFFSLSHTFMTDIPFLFFLLVSLFCYHSLLQKDKFIFRIGGFLFGLCAFLIRQPGILVILVFELGFLCFSDRGRSSWISFTLFLVLLIGGSLGIEVFLKNYLGEKQAFASPLQGFFEHLKKYPIDFLFQLSKRTLMSIFYIGLFSLPFIFPFFKKLKSTNRLNIPLLLLIIVFNILLIYLLYKSDYIFPYGGNILYNWGLGPVLLPDVHRYELTTLPQLPQIITMIFGLPCQIYGCYLAVHSIHILSRLQTKSAKNQFLLLFILFNCCSLIALLSFNFFDRYLLAPTLAFWFILLPSIDLKFKKMNWSVITLFCLYTSFAILGTKDYLNWNRAVKTAHVQLQTQGVNVENIDAGVGFNEFYKDEPYDIDEKYLLTRGAVNGYIKQDSVSFFQYLWWKEGKIYILKQK